MLLSIFLIPASLRHDFFILKALKKAEGKRSTVSL